MISSLSRGSLLAEVIHGGSNEQQLTTYVSWVNSQLRKRPELRLIRDLRHDLQDGVVLSHLIEIVAGEVLEGIHLAPQDRQESRENVEKVLDFITSKRIRMPNTSAIDIVDGNLKAVMRMILALAAHFKPSANQRAASGRGQASGRSSANHSPLSTIALAQGAAAVLATARQDASQPHRHAHCHAHLHSSISSTRAPPSSQSEDSHQEDGSERSVLFSDSLSETFEKEFQETRKMMSTLQAILLHGSLPEDDQEDSLALQGGTPQQQLVIFQSRLDQSMEENQELKRELQRCNDELMTLRGVKEAQQRRLCVQEASILQMRQDLLRATSQTLDLQKRLEESKQLWSQCQKEMEERRSLHHVNTQHPHQLSTSRQSNGFCEGAEPWAGSGAEPWAGSGAEPWAGSGGAELHLVREGLRSLRSCFRHQDPQQHTLDTVEQGIASLTDRLQVLHTHKLRGKFSEHTANAWPGCSGSSTTSTKVLYFIDQSATPTITHIPKRLGEVTLKDVRSALDRDGSYRYHFKALDPEFGTVKEEVFLDGAVVPGWEGKIVVWLEKYTQDSPARAGDCGPWQTTS